MSACKHCEHADEISSVESDIEDKRGRMILGQNFLSAFTDEKILEGHALDDEVGKNFDAIRDRDTSIAYIGHTLTAINEIDCLNVDCDLAETCPRLLPLLFIAAETDSIIGR